MVKVNVYDDPGAIMVPAGILIRVGPKFSASPVASPNPPSRIMLASSQLVLPVFLMVTETE